MPGRRNGSVRDGCGWSLGFDSRVESNVYMICSYLNLKFKVEATKARLYTPVLGIKIDRGFDSYPDIEVWQNFEGMEIKSYR